MISADADGLNIEPALLRLGKSEPSFLDPLLVRFNLHGSALLARGVLVEKLGCGLFLITIHLTPLVPADY